MYSNEQRHSYVHSTEGQAQNLTLPKKTPKVSTFIVGDIPTIASVQARSYKHAANTIAKNLYGPFAYASRIKTLNYISYSECSALFDSCCGYFQCYNIVGDSKARACGEPFHLQKVYQATIAIAATAAKS
jgi:hypothetical protein